MAPCAPGKSGNLSTTRWKVERLFAWLHNFRRLVTRWEHHIENFLGFVHLACLHMLDQAFMRQFRNREYISSQPRKSLLLPAELPPSTIRIFNL